MKLCDCTIRDGGYYTNWEFNKDLIVNYMSTLNNISAIDIVELGYRSTLPDVGTYFNISEEFMAEAKATMPTKILAVMVDEKNTPSTSVKELLRICKPYIKLIRIAVNPEHFDRAVELAKAIKTEGFMVSFNLMYMSNWMKDTSFLLKLIQLEGLVNYIYLVDSYGGVTPEDVASTFMRFRKVLTIPLGFHGHNNLEMAFTNARMAIDYGADLIDCTITGMGRGAGNLKTELMLTYLKATNNLQFNLLALNTLINEFKVLQSQYKWGTSLPYMVCGAYSLPQTEVMDNTHLSDSEIIIKLENKFGI